MTAVTMLRYLFLQAELLKKKKTPHNESLGRLWVKEIPKQLFEMGGLSASDEPLAEGSIYSKWRKSIINTWKPVSLLVDFMFKENISKKIQKNMLHSSHVMQLVSSLASFFVGERLGEKINHEMSQKANSVFIFFNFE